MINAINNIASVAIILYYNLLKFLNRIKYKIYIYILNNNNKYINYKFHQF